ncbi:hypothetical protein LF1_35850 [Rubripirellula obstinata]|uniref:HEAT repeat protein n=1 Tax=Rubripirellula obstinata TaxID=406547 RepID=A0A5B1CL57_9BACT|nr:HEAT repeat domain-containing protein [Rubripirellula obstinata]KAA1261041.1 hypothetical protein LF1_35850 [Rubripirellula obstinata]
MVDLEEVIDQLWLHATFEQDPWTEDRAFAAIKDDGDVAIDGLIWALGQKDLEVKLLALCLLRQFGPEAQRALPAVVYCLGDENRLVRLVAMETAGHWGEAAESAMPMILRNLKSEDDLESVFAAESIRRIGRVRV